MHFGSSFKEWNYVELVSESIWRRYVWTWIISTRRISNVGTESSFHDKNLPSKHRQIRQNLFRYLKRFVHFKVKTNFCFVKCNLRLVMKFFQEDCFSWKNSRKSILLFFLFLPDKWSPALQIRTVLLSIQALLSAPNPDDPLANDVAEAWKANEAQAIETGSVFPLLQS